LFKKGGGWDLRLREGLIIYSIGNSMFVQIEALSVEFTAVILEKDTKHKLPEASRKLVLGVLL